MSESERLPGPDWQPFTPRGVARAAIAPRWQLWIVLGLTAGLSALVLASFLNVCWGPVIGEAISQLPPNGYIRDGIYYPDSMTTDTVLAENSWLSIGIQWSPQLISNQASDVRTTLEIDRLRLCSILGCTTISYHTIGNRSLGRTDTDSWWNAWRPFILAALSIAHIFFLFVIWWLLTLTYSAVIRFLAFYRDRQIDFAGSCRVAQAALIPGALWLIASLFCYQQRWLDMFGLLVVFVFHIPVAWLYLFLAMRHLPLIDPSLKGNPFKPADGDGPDGRTDNPFVAGT
jgi:hypothetical protein